MTDTPRFATRRLLSDCVHCGLCLDACPTYKELGHEPDSPRGRLWLMKALAEGRLEPEAPVVRHLDLCLGCRACETACPSGVQYGVVLEAARAWLEGHHHDSPESGRRSPAVPTRGRRAARSTVERLLRDVVVGRVMADPRLFRGSIHLLRLADRLGLSGLTRFVMPAGFDGRTWARALAPDPLTDWARFPGARAFGTDTVLPGAAPVHGRAVLLTGCVMSGVFGRVNEATAQVLAANGWEVIIPAGAVCCGALAAHAGLADRARQLADGTAARLEWLDADVIVTNAAGCGAMMKEYDHWTSDGAALAARVRDVSQLLALHPLRGPLEPPRRLAPDVPADRPIRIAYHDACHLAHGQRITAQPRALLAAIPGIELVPLTESDVCCGSAGSYNILEPDMATRLGARKVRHLAAAAPDIVVAGNSGCLVQIRGSLSAGGGPVPVTAHLVEVLAAAMPAR